MTTKLFDVYAPRPMIEDTDAPGAMDFVMRAPLATIRAMYDLHDSAVNRLERETAAFPHSCMLHFNRGRLTGSKVMVYAAGLGPLGGSLSTEV